MGLENVISSLRRSPLNFRTVGDLNADILSGLPKLEHDIDLVVGVPRSGMLAASVLALHLNCAMTDVEGFLAGRLYPRGGSRKGLSDAVESVGDAKSVIVLDDSVYSGSELARVRARLDGMQAGRKLTFAAVYCSRDTAPLVDFHFAICPNPRVFEWNVMHHKVLRNTCVDIDGVLCRDPAEEENDDGPKYLKFLRDAESFRIPTVPVGFLVTCRLEKYRNETEAWLADHDVAYDELIMMDLPTKEARQKAGGYGEFKAKACKNVGAEFFIESSERQAVVIAQMAGVDVYCVETNSLVRPSKVRERVSNIVNGPRRMIEAARRIILGALRVIRQ